jgi:two-component system OmpR family sensor kinase
MDSNQLFAQTRWRLTRGYAGIFSLIFSIFALGVYEAIVHAHKITLNQELETVGGTIHDSLETTLVEPEQLNPQIFNLFPDICLVSNQCHRSSQSDTHFIGAIEQGQYYLQFFDLSGDLVAIVGRQPQGLSINYNPKTWQDLRDDDNIRYRQISLELHTQDNQKWGYLHLGKSMEQFDRYVNNVRWILLLGLPLIIAIVVLLSWYLAGQAMQPIYHSYRQIQQFTADAAHELRTPLAAIQATIESSLMSPQISEEDSQDVLITIKRQNQRLSSLVADLLTLCRMERQVVWSSKSKVVVNDLIMDIAEEFAALALSQEITLDYQIKTPEILTVIGDEEQLYRLIANLTINAIQNTDKQGKVTLVLQQKYQEVVMEVIDTGIGISEEEQKLIFDRFYRVNKARSREKGGSGLGLAIAQAIAIHHGGRIEVHSQLGKGSTFSLYLPINLK